MATTDQIAMRTLRGLGWQWYPGGVVVRVQTDQGMLAVWVPLATVWLSFAGELPPTPSVGYPHTVGGFGSWLKKASRSVKRAARSAVPKSIRRGAGKVLRQAATYAVVPTYALHSLPGMRQATQLAASAAPIPVVQQAARATLTAQQHLDRFVRTGKVDPVKAVRQGVSQYVAARGTGAAGKLASDLARGTQAAQLVAQGAQQTRQLRGLLSRGMAAKRKLERLQRLAVRGDPRAMAQLRAAVRSSVPRPR